MKHLTSVSWILPAILGCISVLTVANGADYKICPGAELKPILKKVQPGDSIVLEDGNWRDAQLKFELIYGSADAPIHIRAQTAGQSFSRVRPSSGCRASTLFCQGLFFEIPRT